MFDHIYYLIFVLTLITTSLLVPQVKKFSIKNNFFDDPNKRKQHKNPKPRLGGLAVFISFIISCGISSFLLKGSGNSTNLINIFMIFGSCFFLLGFIDDLKSLSPFFRLFMEFLFAIFIFKSGLRINSFINPFVFNNSNILFLPNTLNNVFSILWIVGVTNAINWIDGLDGLLVSVVSIFNFSLLIRFTETNNIEGILLSLILLSTCLGFLRFNKFPSSIFLGDGGSYFLGFVLSALTLISFTNNSQETFNSLGLNSFDVLGASLFLLVPLADMCRVIFIRLRNKKSPFYSDRNHLHHLLLERGLTVNQTVISILCLIMITTFIVFLRDYLVFS
tara:strand:+ start:1414 stop:2415 length:1002 start_codon:yes stop_codon:yes gene_type:complete